MGKTNDNKQETITTAGFKYTQRSDLGRFDEEGNYQCVRCGFKHTARECAEYRLVHANKELDKVIQFLHVSAFPSMSGESPVDTLIRGYKTVAHNLKITKPETHTEVTEMLRKGEEKDVGD